MVHPPLIRNPPETLAEAAQREPVQPLLTRYPRIPLFMEEHPLTVHAELTLMPFDPFPYEVQSETVQPVVVAMPSVVFPEVVQWVTWLELRTRMPVAPLSALRTSTTRDDTGPLE